MEITLLVSIVLVVLVVFVFLRNVWATVIPSISVPLSLVGTFGVMYLLGYTLDNLSLMALTISTGFVVDDAIVVIENIARHLEAGMKPFAAALQGSREIGFTVISMSTSLVAVFIPILLMAGIVGRLFREFAVTLSIAIGVSLLVSLTTTPMMCARFLRPATTGTTQHIVSPSAASTPSTALRRVPALGLAASADGAGHHDHHVLCEHLSLCYRSQRLFPAGRYRPAFGRDHRRSRQLLDRHDRQDDAICKIIEADPAIDTLMAFSGGGSINQARMFAQLKPLNSGRKVSSDQVINRLRGKLAIIPGATVYLQVPQDVSVGGRGSNSQFQYTLQADDLNELNHWAGMLLSG